MPDGFLVILAILAVICIPSLLLIYGIKHIKSRTQITGLIIITFASLGFGVIYNCLRFLVFQYLGTFHEFIDILSFQVNVFFSLLGFSAAFRIISILSTQSGHKIEQASIFRFLYIFVMLTISGVNVLTYQKTDPLESGFYAYQMHPIVFFITLGFFIPLFIFIIYKFVILAREIESKPLIKEAILICVLLSILSVERFYNMGYYLFPLSNSTLLLDFVLITIIWACAHLLYYMDSDFVESIATYFSVKTIYILNRKDGRIIYEQTLSKEDVETSLIPNQLLLGGFFYAMSSGLEEMLEVKGKIEAIQFGTITILFKHSDYIFGTLFITVDSPLVHRKLNTFMNKFETHYQQTLEHWTGDLTEFNPEEINSWTKEIFR